MHASIIVIIGLPSRHPAFSHQKKANLSLKLQAFNLYLNLLSYTH